MNYSTKNVQSFKNSVWEIEEGFPAIVRQLLETSIPCFGRNDFPLFKHVSRECNRVQEDPNESCTLTLDSSERNQREGIGLLEYQAMPTLRDVAHDGWLCTISI